MLIRMRILLSTSRRRLAALAALMVAGLAPVAVSQPAQAAVPTCQTVTVHVALAPATPVTYRVAGELCAQGPLAGKTVQFLEHGLTYNHHYWDWPQQPSTYSYVHQAVQAGYATFNIDRLGDGRSDHPDPALLTTETQAFVAHQVVQHLRAHFPKVISVGHSFGSAIALYEGGTYADVDAVLLTGQMHAINPDVFPAFATDFYPAELDPQFAGAGLPPGYLTSVPGVRGTLFYNSATADPAVIAADEAHKDLLASGEAATITDAQNPALSLAITVPVALAVGQQDFIVCNPSLGPAFSCADSAAVLAREAPDYGPHACLEAYVLASSGHDINLHPSAGDWFAFALSWADRRVGRDAAHGPTQPCP
jgi:pimeloyl-ACP methyl ester carboxylesterase